MIYKIKLIRMEICREVRKKSLEQHRDHVKKEIVIPREMYPWVP